MRDHLDHAADGQKDLNAVHRSQADRHKLIKTVSHGDGSRQNRQKQAQADQDHTDSENASHFFTQCRKRKVFFDDWDLRRISQSQTGSQKAAGHDGKQRLCDLVTVCIDDRPGIPPVDDTHLNVRKQFDDIPREASGRPALRDLQEDQVYGNHDRDRTQKDDQ